MQRNCGIRAPVMLSSRPSANVRVPAQSVCKLSISVWKLPDAWNSLLFEQAVSHQLLFC